MRNARVHQKDLTEVVLVGGMSKVPKVIQIVKDVFGKEPYPLLDIDEAVAMGAAIQAGVVIAENSTVSIP